MPNPIQIRQEDMSVAYLTALCAANGYTLMHEEHDNDGVDKTIKCKDKPAENCLMKSPKLDVQLKSCFSKHIRFNSNGDICYDLESKNYNVLVDNERITPIILIVLHMHDDENLWIEQTPDYLKITKCAYWISLVGEPSTNNSTTKTITIPASNVLSKDTLRNIMIKVANNEKL
ncbi:MAG: DUF4365 domain-containing protein [Paludibacteraceae bacterium]|nr:DUF4365 domain-containing protein [Paludibacteraceae bacterium]